MIRSTCPKLNNFDLPGIDWLGRSCVMKFYYLTFRSVTFAQRGEKLLQKSGIRCTLLRTPF